MAKWQSGKVAWDVPLGTTAGIGPLALPFGFTWGAPNFGGALLTGSGLAIIAATTDARLRAFATLSGELLWETRLPAGGHATPITYQGSDGRQYLVIAAGGHVALPGPKGDHIVAYALPRR